ncbi:MAG TPA: hypothetical protein VM434_00595 [Beijerinckiaceae bacterium]|nr:hypothetical protein [Beijerinckiaceae bacterium]
MSAADKDAYTSALLSVIGCLVSELTKRGALSLTDLLDNIRATASAHRDMGSTITAAHTARLADYLEKTSKEPPIKPPTLPRG